MANIDDEKVLKILAGVANGLDRLNRNLEFTREVGLPNYIDDSYFTDNDVFDTRFFLPMYQQSKTPVKIIVGRQGQLGFLSQDQDGKILSQVWLNKFEVELLKSVMRHKLMGGIEFEQTTTSTSS
jgi:hypothetical protein